MDGVPKPPDNDTRSNPAAFRPARREGMTVFVLHAAEPEPELVGWKAGPGVVRAQVGVDFDRERSEIRAITEKLRERGVDAVGLVVQGPTVPTILDEARRREADLVVVGSHGHGAAYDLAIGSVSSGVIRKAPVPVLVVPCRARSAERARSRAG